MSEKKQVRRARGQKYKAKAKASPQYKNVSRKVPMEIRRQVIRPNISKCAQEYIASLVNPFDQNLMPCIPSFFPLPSQKCCTFIKTTFQLGTTGFGYAIARATTDSDANVAMICTTSASVGGAATNLSAFTNLTPILNANNQYNSAALTGANVQSRVVSYGIRVRYLGREDARNGTVMMIETLDREDINSRTYNGVALWQNATKTVPSADRDWISAVYSGPSNPDDIDFLPTGVPLGTNYCIGALISGVAGDSYEVEFIQHVEYSGRQALSKTESHTDQKGFDVAVQQMKTVANNKAIEPAQDGPGILTRFVSGMAQHADTIYEGVKTIGGIMSLDPSSILRTAFSALTMGSGRGVAQIYGSEPPRRLLGGGFSH